MTIDEKTAQLILDAIAWCNKDWAEVLEWTHAFDIVASARIDFVRFCKARGIESISVPKIISL